MAAIKHEQLFTLAQTDQGRDLRRGRRSVLGKDVASLGHNNPAHRLEEYNEAAHSARERCFIGGRSGPGVVYDVGLLRIWESMT